MRYCVKITLIKFYGPFMQKGNLPHSGVNRVVYVSALRTALSLWNYTGEQKEFHIIDVGV